MVKMPMAHAIIEPQRDERDGSNEAFKKYRKRSLQSLDQEYQELLADPPDDYDVTQPFNSETNQKYRAWFKKKVEMEECLNARKAIEGYPVQKKQQKSEEEKFQSYINVYKDILTKLANIKAGSPRWLELRDKARRVRVLVQKEAFRHHLEWNLPDLPPIPEKKG